MQPLVPNTDDLISVLDRVLDKGITIESWAQLSLMGCDLIATDSRVTVQSSAVYVGYGTRGSWRKMWNWTIYFPSGGANSGANNQPARSPKKWRSTCRLFSYLAIFCGYTGKEGDPNI